jgi:hypothetical protein
VIRAKPERRASTVGVKWHSKAAAFKSPVPSVVVLIKK